MTGAPDVPTLPHLTSLQAGWRGDPASGDAVLVVSCLFSSDGDEIGVAFTLSPEDARRVGRELISTAKLAAAGEKLWTPK